MKPTLIIAEAGVNHNGSIDMAKRLIDAAADAGVDYVKFQTFRAENLVTKNAAQADYQKKNSTAASQYEMLKKLELSEERHMELIGYCKERNVRFLSTAFDFDSIEFLHKLSLGLWKIPSGEITNYPYLKRIAQYGEPVIMSTGMTTIDETRQAVEALCGNGLSKNQITLLHCNTEYPTPMRDVNLRAMLTLQREFNVPVGYSDHTLGIEVPIAAVAMGATVIEKHFTLDRTLPGPDHKASLEPHELKSMVKGIRNIEQALGNGVKDISESERKNITVARKSIVAATHIHKGDIYTEQNICVKRPGGGISPMRWEEMLGMHACREFEPDELIEI